ncbi:MAG: hypothetical protein AAF570_17975, partial [Bacteroidota bacterium]
MPTSKNKPFSPQISFSIIFFRLVIQLDFALVYGIDFSLAKAKGHMPVDPSLSRSLRAGAFVQAVLYRGHAVPSMLIWRISLSLR